MTFMLDSPAFQDGHAIPRRYARDGDNVSPPLRWSGAPRETKSFALIVEDPDAPSGVFRHWAAHGIPANRSELPEGAGRAEQAQTLLQGVNDFGDAWYDGPQPPRGHGAHHYRFRMLALDVEKLDVPRDASVEEIGRVARRHAIDEAEIVGTFERR